MPENSASERRQAIRKLVDIDVILSCKTHAGDRHKVRVYDLSLTGMAIVPNGLAVNVGDTVCICLSDSNNKCDRDHLIEATVMHQNSDLAGIRFDSVGIHILKDIQNLLHDIRYF